MKKIVHFMKIYGIMLVDFTQLELYQFWAQQEFLWVGGLRLNHSSSGNVGGLWKM